MTSKTDQVNEIYKKVETEAGGYFIPAKGKEDIYSKNTRLRVCAYCRVSTDNDAQMSSFELQQEHYQNLVGSHPNWDLQHIYADEGISGTSLKKRDEFNAMIAACRAGQFIWTRVSDDEEADKKWNADHFGGSKSITITNDDVKIRATFCCDLIDTTTRQSLL